jgi:beta-ribofuranosylaminobenzene 5'-phosphate synthase
MARVAAGARLHFGFRNLSLARERLYGGLGVALETPRVVVEAEPAPTVEAEDPVRTAAERSVGLLGVPGARVRLVESLPRHVGLGSGTQHALAVHAAVAAAHGREPRVREHAPDLGRGGRSGVGVAAFETGGFLLDGGHPTARFTSRPPDRGEWTVPPVIARLALPEAWRFVLAVPAAVRGRSGDDEDAAMRAAVERADDAVAADLNEQLLSRVLPAAAAGDREALGHGLAAFGRLNGAWYTDVQGGVYRPPAGAMVERLADCPAVTGAGQSSWGPAVWGLTTADRAGEARAAARAALEAADVKGTALVARPRNDGATVRR